MLINIKPGDKVLVDVLPNHPKTYLVGTVDEVEPNFFVWRPHFRNMDCPLSRRSRVGIVKVLHPDTDLGEAYEELLRIQNARDDAVLKLDQLAQARSEGVDMELMKRKHG